MIKNCNNFFYLNKFFKKIILKKRYIQKLKNKISFLNITKKQNHKKLNTKFYNQKYNFIIVYIIEVYFSQTNTLVHLISPVGKLKFFCSAGNLLFKGKSKKARISVLLNIIHILIKKLTFLKDRPVMLRLKNVGFKKNWILKKLKRKIFINTIIGFNLYSHNGCRKKKVCRKKLKLT